MGQNFFLLVYRDLINQPFSSPMEEEQNIPNCQTGDKNTLPAGNLKISPEQNIELISPPDQLKRETRKNCLLWLGSNMAPSYGINGSWEQMGFKILYENCVMNLKMVGWANYSIRADMW